MGERVAEYLIKNRLFGPKRKLRVDLHGASIFEPNGDSTLIRWEWIQEMFVSDGVVIRSSRDEIRYPKGAFGLDPAELEKLLQSARSITDRAGVIARLSSNS